MKTKMRTKKVSFATAAELWGFYDQRYTPDGHRREVGIPPVPVVLKVARDEAPTHMFLGGELLGFKTGRKVRV